VKLFLLGLVLKENISFQKKVLNGPALDYAGDFQEVSLPQVFE
jgi:hypothetical protein